ncbi:MAG: EAL domain-containing protein [Clostridiaceae bacterium]|nr:EAL domain-containing protein [Clostridiaceae bacterium]
MKTISFVYTYSSDFRNYVKSIHFKSNHEILIQVFTGIFDKSFIKSLIIEIKECLPHAKIIGTTATVGIFEAEFIKDSCVVSISIFENTNIKTYEISKNSKHSYELGKQFANGIYKDKTKAIIAFATPFKMDGQDLINGITHYDRNLILCGGFSGHKVEDSKIKRFVFTENNILEDGVVGACLYGDNLIVNSFGNCSWLPIGKDHVVTEVNGNLIISIDNIPVFTFYSNYIGQENIELVSGIKSQFPLMIKINHDYTALPINSLTEGYIETNIKVPIGSIVKLGYGNINQLIDATRKNVNLAEEIPIESLFNYSCIGRQVYLGDLVNYEMKPLRKALSVNGFFTFGEFVHNNGHNSFESLYTTFLGLSENEESRIKLDHEQSSSNEDPYFSNYRIMYNIIKYTTEELDDINLNLEKKIEQKTDELKIQYNTDSLTKLPNRIKLLSDLQNNKDCQLALLDILDFSELNDFYGIRIGDKVLIEFAERLNELKKNYGVLIYRVGSDVFGIIDTLKQSDVQFYNLVHEFNNILKHSAFICENTKIYININVGISAGRHSILEKAEMALDFSKHSSNNFKIYSENMSMMKTYKNNLNWITELREAINEDRIVPFFQPIHNNISGKIQKYESLMRLISKDGTVVTPVYFLEIAKKSGIYTELTQIMINKSFHRFKDLNYEFSINISVEDIMDIKTRKLIYEKLKDKAMATKAIFELVETEDIVDYAEIKEFIDKVHQFGAKIAIDDFGSGYSNFEYIIKLNIDYIKIDGSIIKNITNDKASEILADTIFNFALKLGIDVIAEFVHNEAVYNKVKEIGITFSQGYYFSEPNSEVICEIV